MRALVIAAACVLAACGSARYQTIRLVNQSPHAIESVYVYPTGSQQRGASRGALAPNATVELRVKEGNVDVLAVTAKEQLANGQRERKEATQTLELRAPVELVFHDATQTIPDRPGTIGVMFRVLPPPAEPASEPADAPAP